MTTIALDEHGRSPFRAAVETKDFGQVARTLAQDIHFRSPVVFKPYEGREAVAGLLAVVGEVLGPELVYRWQVQEGDREVLCFTSRVDGRDIEGIDALRYDAGGLVCELVVFMRPASGLEAMKAAMGARLAALEASAGGHLT